ncbi:MAG: hypothetical protein AAFO84_01135 [Cyanobacteria bacterium J06598_1]
MISTPLNRWKSSPEAINNPEKMIETNGIAQAESGAIAEAIGTLLLSS